MEEDPSKFPKLRGNLGDRCEICQEALKEDYQQPHFHISGVQYQVEAVLNSRPIAPLEIISEEGLEAMTPGHFLVGHALQSLPTDITSSNRVSSIKRWNLLQKLTEEFWQQWKADYLLHLNRYRKWLSPTPNLKKGDVVLCRDLGEFANHTWPLARIKEVHPGSDDRVRLVTLRVGKRLLKRPLS